MIYQLIDMKEPKEFNTAVNNFLTDGWEIAGNTFSYVDGQNKIHFCVPMVKD